MCARACVCISKRTNCKRNGWRKQKRPVRKLCQHKYCCLLWCEIDNFLFFSLSGCTVLIHKNNTLDGYNNFHDQLIFVLFVWIYIIVVLDWFAVHICTLYSANLYLWSSFSFDILLNQMFFFNSAACCRKFVLR
jgi:hypothetical protein